MTGSLVPRIESGEFEHHSLGNPSATLTDSRALQLVNACNNDDHDVFHHLNPKLLVQRQVDSYCRPKITFPAQYCAVPRVTENSALTQFWASQRSDESQPLPPPRPHPGNLRCPGRLQIAPRQQSEFQQRPASLTILSWCQIRKEQPSAHPDSSGLRSSPRSAVVGRHTAREARKTASACNEESDRTASACERTELSAAAPRPKPGTLPRPLTALSGWVFTAVLFIGDTLLLVGQAPPRRTAPGQYRCFQTRSTVRNRGTDHVSHLVPLPLVFLNGRRIITVSGKDVDSPNKAFDIRPSVRGRIWATAFYRRSKHVKAPDNFSSTPEAWDLAIRRAPLQYGRDLQRQTLTPRERTWVRESVARPRCSYRIQALGGVFSAKDPWQISHTTVISTQETTQLF